MKRIICLALSGLLALSLVSCGEKKVASSQESAVASDALGNAEASKMQTPTLFIGRGETFKEVTCTAEGTPEAVIAALAAETGWNLAVKSITVRQPVEGAVTIAFAADSAIYTDPPESQKDAYHVFDVEDWVFTVLSSVEETLRRNFDISGVAFASPEGGDVDVGNESVKFHFNCNTLWEYSGALQCNQPLPKDSIGQVVLWPQSVAEDKSSYVSGGLDTLFLTFQRPEVTFGTGKLTVYNEDGSVYDVVSTDRMQSAPAKPEELVGTHFKNATCVKIALNKILLPNKSYQVGFDAGLFVGGNASNKELSKENWSIIMSNYGVVADNLPANRSKTVKVGQPITYDFVLGGTASQCEITLYDSEMADITPAKITADGSITVTPKKAGVLTLQVWYTLKDTGEIIGDVDYLTAVE
ncbi:MAG: hypothetical protein RR276_06135 [Angelakisella sp.]